MADWQNDPAEQRETAYTVPADADGADSFQYHTTLRQNPAPQEYRKQKRKYGAAAAICLIAATALLAGAALFVLRFKVSFSNDSGAFGIHVKRRSAIIASGTEAGSEVLSLDITDRVGPQGASPWQGSKLRLEPQDGEGVLPWAQVYRSCGGFAASVTAVFPDGSAAEGSGIVISEDGFIITSSHVVLSAASMNAAVMGREYEARLVGLDISSDLAVIKIDAQGLDAAEFGSSASSAPGDELAVIGSTVTGSIGIVTGRLSSVEDSYKYRGFPLRVCQVILPLSAQYSGAPLIDSRGRVIGIVNTDIADQYEDSEGMEFAVPIEAAKPIIDELLEHGYVAGRPSTGISVSEIPASYAVFYNYPSCIYITAVNENSTAYEAGVRKGDLIVSANGQRLNSVDELYEIINGMKAGEELSLELYREREFGTLSFPLMEAAQLAG